MEPDPRFLGLEPRFWANVRSISQHCGYQRRGSGVVKSIGVEDMIGAMRDLGLTDAHLIVARTPTDLARRLASYFEYRAAVLNEHVRGLLMKADEAEAMFDRLRSDAPASLAYAMNKQKGEKRAPAYFSAIIKILVSREMGGLDCDFDPQELTTFTDHAQPIRTLARRVDGAFPSPVNPIALWEIKEYYYTTTFGSRIADGVYESLLDGTELDEMRRTEGVSCHHYFMVDAVDTWWSTGGRPYLCRVIDMMHMGLVDEALFVREVEARLPVLASAWVELLRRREERNG